MLVRNTRLNAGIYEGDRLNMNYFADAACKARLRTEYYALNLRIKIIFGGWAGRAESASRRRCNAQGVGVAGERCFANHSPMQTALSRLNIPIKKATRQVAFF